MANIFLVSRFILLFLQNMRNSENSGYIKASEFSKGYDNKGKGSGE